MQPGFVESFQPDRKIYCCLRDGNGSIPIYPAWHTIDCVFIAINIVNTHRVLGELNLKSWDLTIYDSGSEMFVMQVRERVKDLRNRMHE